MPFWSNSSVHFFHQFIRHFSQPFFHKLFRQLFSGVFQCCLFPTLQVGVVRFPTDRPPAHPKFHPEWPLRFLFSCFWRLPRCADPGACRANSLRRCLLRLLSSAWPRPGTCRSMAQARPGPGPARRSPSACTCTRFHPPLAPAPARALPLTYSPASTPALSPTREAGRLGASIVLFLSCPGEKYFLSVSPRFLFNCF